MALPSMDDGEPQVTADLRPITDDLIEFIDSYADMVYRRAGKLLSISGLSSSDAEEVTAEVAKAAVDAWVSGRLTELKPNWLMVVVKRVVRRRATVANRSVGGELAATALQKLAARAEWCDDGGDGLVLEALGCLSDRHRQLICWSAIDGLSDRDIAQRLGQPLDTIRSARERARKSLRRHYDRLIEETRDGGVSNEH